MLQFQNLQKTKQYHALWTNLHRDYSVTINTNAGSASITIPKNKIIVAKQ